MFCFRKTKLHRKSEILRLQKDWLIQQKMVSSFQKCKDSNVTWSFKNEFLSFLLMGIPLWHVERRMSPLSCWDPVQ